MPALGRSSKKSPGKIKKAIGKVRKKWMPTFDEQFSDAKKSGKKTFKSTRDDTKKGKLEYHTRTKAEEDKAQKRHTNRERAMTGDKSKQLSERGAKFKLAKKMGKDTFTHKGKKYTTLLKGEKKKKPLISGKGWNKKINISLPELSGKTSKKIKRFVGAKGGGRIAGAARKAQEHGWYSPDMGMKGRRMYAKGGLIRGKPKLAVKGW